MASQDVHPEALTSDPDALDVGAPEMAWSQAWQVPVLLLGLSLLLIGFYFLIPNYTEPDYAGILSDVEQHLAAQDFTQAEDKLDMLLDDPVFMAKEDPAMMGHVWQLYGDLRFYQIDRRVWQGITTSVGIENLRRIEGYYRDAENLQRELPRASLRRYAETLAALGEDQAALAIVDRMPRDMDPPRHSLVRDLIERVLITDPEPTSPELARLIVRFEQELSHEDDEQVKLEEQVWVMSVRCQRLLQAGDPDAVLGMLLEGGLQDLLRRDATELQLAPLKVLLAEAYIAVSADQSGTAASESLRSAGINLREVQGALPDGHPLNPRIMVAFGDLALAGDHDARYEHAYSHYNQAYHADQMGPSSIDAIIGLAQAEANRPGRFPEAVQWFDRGVQRMVEGQVPPHDPRRERLAQYLRDILVQRELQQENYANALALMQAYEPLEAPDLTAQTLLNFGMIYLRLAEESEALALALAPDPADPGDDPHVQARRVHNQEAAMAYEQAGDYFRRQAAELTHTTTEHGDALWQSAHCYERAQLWGQAVEVYGEFLDTSDQADRREEAQFRIAQALLADGQPESAVPRLRSIIETAPTGEWAKSSYVPLAQGLADMQRWGEAEALLRSVLEDHASIGPDSPYYYDAMIALGRLMYRRGEEDPRYYARAIEVLGEDGGAVERIQRSGQEQYLAQLPQLRYMLADSLRLSAQGLLEESASARTETERLAMLSERTRRLQDAQMYYNQVVYELEQFHVDAMSPMDLLYFRNAQFYQADCAFERGDYEGAIGLYLNAVSRWQDHPVALVGWVQIMNARAELGEIEAARIAHARALELFRQMPEGAFHRADSLMTREHWEDWFEWGTELNLFSEEATAGVQTPG